MPSWCHSTVAYIACATQRRSNPVSGRCLPKTGNISIIRQRLSVISLLDCSNWECRDRASTCKKAPLAGISGIFGATISSCTTAWLGREDSNLDMAISKSDALACPRGVAEPLFIRIHKRLETLEFRESYRTRRVQSSGEKRAIWRKMGGPCRVEVRNPNQKSLLKLGLISNILARRIEGCGEAGGGRGTGVEPSPRKPA